MWSKRSILATSFFRILRLTQPTKVAGGTLRRAVRSWTFAGILGGRDMECAYYFGFCRLCRVCLAAVPLPLAFPAFHFRLVPSDCLDL